MSTLLCAIFLLAQAMAWHSTGRAAASPLGAATEHAPPQTPAPRPEQEAPRAGGDFKFKVDVQLVTVDTVVRDAQGAIVGDLRAEDFAIYDSGVEQKITHFSTDQLPLAVALLVDCSASVGRYLPDLRRAALSALQRLKPEDPVVLYSFDACPKRHGGLTVNRAEITAAIGRLTIGNSTNIYDTIVESARYLRQMAPHHRRALILISDNYSFVFRADEEQALQEALETSSTLFSIQTPGSNPVASKPANRRPTLPVIRDNGPNSIARITLETGGEVLELGDKGKFARSLDAVISNLRRSYTLGFVPSNVGEPGSLHPLVVRFNTQTRCPGCSILARRGYYYLGAAPATPQKADPSATDAPSDDCSEILAGLRTRTAEAQFGHFVRMAAGYEREIDFISFKSTAVRAAGVDGQPVIDVGLQVDPSRVRLKSANSHWSGTLRVAIFSVDSKGGVHDERWSSVEIDLSDARYRQVMKSTMSFSIQLTSRPAMKQLKVIVYDMGSQTGGSRLVKIK